MKIKLSTLIVAMTISAALSFAVEMPKNTIAVFSPILENTVSSDDGYWLSDVVQGKLVNAFFTYSNFVPFDQGVMQSAINEIKESQNSTAYDEDTMLQAGRYIQARYYAYVRISYLNKDRNYNMTFYILDIETGRTLATFDDKCTREQLRVKNGNIIYKAVYEMLSHRRMNSEPYSDGQFKKAKNWSDLEKFVGADGRKK